MIELSADLRPFFERPDVGHIATLLPDGAPHSVPVWVGLEGGHISVLTSPGSRKARNLDRDPRAAISLTRHDRVTEMAEVRGRVVERLEGDPAWAIIDRMSHRYIGADYPLRTDRVVYLIEPEHARATSFG